MSNKDQKYAERQAKLEKHDVTDAEVLKQLRAMVQQTPKITEITGITVEEMVTEKSGQTGEKVELAYYGRIEAPYCNAYVHFNKKLGTILGFNKEVSEEVAHAIAMQATAMAPISIDENDCPAEVVEKEKAIALEMMKQDPKNANKPEAILAKIAEGKMRKFFEENTLLNQALVGEKISIREFLQQADKEATIVAYKRFALEA